jgi:nucleoside-diphosphate-sugar epimerase
MENREAGFNQVFGTTRAIHPTDKNEENDRVVLFDSLSTRDLLKRATHLLISAAPDSLGDPVLNVYGDIIRQYAKNFVWVGYLSTTAVYGDHHGMLVTENTPCLPTTERGKYRLRAEQEWLALRDLGLPVQIFRLAGIYGSGRGPVAKVLSGKARCIIKPRQIFSRIHVEDICRILEASIDRAENFCGEIFNVCDDFSAPPQDVIAFAARLLGRKVPDSISYEDAEMPDMARSFYSESKRVSNEKMKIALEVALLYPTYREGLAALVDNAGVGFVKKIRG